MLLPEDDDLHIFPTSVVKPNQESNFRCYDCYNDCSELSELQHCDGADQCYTSVTKNEHGIERLQRGCSRPGQLQLCNPSTAKFVRAGLASIFCCKGDWCNNGTFTSLSSPQKHETSESSSVFKLCFGIIVCSTIVIVLIALYLLRNHRKHVPASERSFDDDYTDELIQITPSLKDNSVKECVDLSASSGSGFGLPVLMQRNLAKQIDLIELIGKGKYGEVWKGTWNGENIAVKIFFSKDEASWARETEIYSTLAIRHSNILSYFASDMTSRNSTTQLWLMTEYHVFGSLYDYLNSNVLDYEEMLRFCSGIATGVNHLHSEIFGVNFVQAKPAIAHRDIKTKNILVKQNKECVLADFGLAVTYYQKTGKLTIAPNPRVGTKRYMAPEILDERINMRSFDSFKKADVYSLGLVFWEICRRTSSNGIVDEYQPPFYDCVGPDPSFDEMRKVVSLDQRRPKMSERWYTDPVIRSFINLIAECWHQKPNVRLYSLRILKNINRINVNV